MPGTIDAVMEDLLVDGMLLRYRSEHADDGLPGREGAFLMCTFWLVNCLAVLGRLEEAEKLFESLREVRNDVGLLSEQFDPSAGRLLGNFPQAFSHVAFVTSAGVLEAAGRTRAIDRGGE